MANPCCQVCGRSFCGADDHESWKSPFCCPKCEHVEEIFEKILDENSRLSRQTNEIQHSVLKILYKFSKEALEKDTVEVPVEMMKRLWEAAELKWHEYNRAESFYTAVCLEGQIALRAANLFRDVCPVNIKKLQELREAVVKQYEFNNWQKDLKGLNRTPEEIIDMLAKERNAKPKRRWFRRLFARQN